MYQLRPAVTYCCTVALLTALSPVSVAVPNDELCSITPLGAVMVCAPMLSLAVGAKIILLTEGLPSSVSSTPAATSTCEPAVRDKAEEVALLSTETRVVGR